MEPKIRSKVEIIDKVGWESWKALDALASQISQSPNPEARLENVIKTLELKAGIKLKRKFPDIKTTEVEGTDDDSEEESGSISSSTSYSTDMHSSGDDIDSEADLSPLDTDKDSPIKLTGEV